ncbi:hypothetical protein IQ270_08170 [Microcoleus sp. LEGE 07076]|uniref:hypothetical protein n=1 Tax=Microcoleus sp. LEGE 07076 TaxID=915322 RepID=UPI001882F984|nr:hypothetical protein [Microcoleus sp. LEGE 07076]MBE9184694.1 hypothetical protein [Microcoleus sp. LEGE 07076]
MSNFRDCQRFIDTGFNKESNFREVPNPLAEYIFPNLQSNISNPVTSAEGRRMSVSVLKAAAVG